MQRKELARFLHDRRARVGPGDVGLPEGGPRRIPGLRREEVAELAHMSTDYYTRLEQARGPRPSPRILDALADVFRLGTAERAHLFRLAGTDPAPPLRPVRRVRPHVISLLHRIPDTAALVTDAAYNVVACNPLADALFCGDLRGRATNLARRRFLSPGPVFESTSADEFGHIVVARLRAAAGRYPRDEPLASLLAELRGSEEFNRIWVTDPVHDPGHRTKTIEHPEVGRLRLNCDVLAVAQDDQQVVFVTADEGTPSARALRHLSGRARTATVAG